MSIFRDLWWFFKLEKTKYIIGVLLLMLVSFLNLFPPYAVGKIVDQIKGQTLTTEQLLLWILLILLAGILMYVLRYIWRMMIFGSAVKLGALLRQRLYDHFTKLSPQFYHKHRIGDLMAHSTNDIQAIEGTAGEGVLTLVDSLTMGTLVIVAMATTISWKLTLITLLPMPFMAWLTNFYGSLVHERFFQAQDAFSHLNEKVQENVSGIRVIKAFGQEEAEKNAFANQSMDTVKKNIAVAKVDSLFDPTIQLIVGISFFLAVAFGAKFVIGKEMTIGQLTSFTIYLGQLIWPMLAFGWLFNIVERGRASYDRVQELLHVKPAIVDKVGAIKQPPTGDLAYQINSFTYPEQEKPTLRNVDFTLKKGQTLGVIGKTGSGKTTLLRLLLREFDLDQGDITINYKSIYDYTLDALRSSVGYVPQEHFLFSGTITENISFAKPKATLEEVIEVAKLAAIHKDILQFEEKYETMVGERGVTLSGGQKQRISIARALLIDPEILILDDALSAVDAKTEEGILQSLLKNRLNKTTLISSHRLSAVQHADLIIVLEEGQIIERGSHEELMQLEGWYKEMYQRQQLEFLVEKGGVSE
ncbi:ABC transporter transmembrane domain-containing protein [Tepidibacillus sp. HK-1]|uniref:ABC transporter transmembrane domain-containing protein n=1 Tax=Tepidibacillus sp. HK-1 TaxID=1883407 RepID=UPI000852BF0D|nr:ABC transporter transmembrane domain-containing protein [Tepidibacillus sp. HK-1]GBF12442.1 putative multidrug resistance ABC transporter ATP-binding/permease protein YheI [Tepidibacillus sp. HK-1]